MAKRKEKTTLSLKDDLRARSKELHGSNSVLGITLLTQPGYISGSRSMMWTNHFKQLRTLNHPEVPKVSTGAENMVGKYSTHNYRIEKDLKIVEKIERFSQMPGELYFLITYDEEKDKYDIIEKRKVCNLTEFYGFRYNTSNMDSKKVGDILKKDEILYASTSYDENGNYRFGTNKCTAYMLDPYTIEDAIIISESMYNSTDCTDVHPANISLNDNDILANLYGDNDNYKCFPDIGENIKNGMLACSKRIHNNQLLFDAKKQNLRKVNFATDTPYYFEHGTVEDIFIYSNKNLDEVPDNRFYAQIKKYLIMQEEFFQKMHDVCKEIIESGSKYSDDISYQYSRAVKYLDKNSKWVSENNIAFNNMIISFEVSQISKGAEGQKFTGRSGNKGVVSLVLPDDQMPYTEYGKRVDVIVNALGVVNRMNSFQIIELEMNFISDLVVERLKITETLEEKEDIVFSVLYALNDEPEVTDKLKAIYDGFTTEGKEKFFESVIKHGLYFKVNPLWEHPEKPIFYRLSDLFDKFTWLKPTKCYVNRFGRKIEIMRDMVVADLYYIKLRQSSKKGYTARSTGSISKLGVPEKSNKAKNHQDMNPRTPIRAGNMETVNLLIGVMPEVIAKLHKYYRTSVTGRQELGERLMSSTTELETIETDEVMVNTNAQILNAYLKVLGIRIEFSDEEREIVRYDDGSVEEWLYEDSTFIGSVTDYEKFVDRQRAMTNIKNGKIMAMYGEDYDKLVEKETEYMRHEREGTTIEINL